MVATIIFLGMVTIISVVIETKYEPENKHIGKSKPDAGNTGASDTENHTIEPTTCPLIDNSTLEHYKCKKCTALQLESGLAACEKTGFIAQVKCTDTQVITVSCEEPAHEKQRSFWVHEGVWFGIGVISYLYVHFRRSSLDQKVLDKVNKQIASGV